MRVRGTFRTIRVGGKYGYSFNPIGNMSWRRLKMYIEDFRAWHLNQDQHFLKMKWVNG